MSSLRPNQAAIWTGQRLAGEAPLYNMAMRFDIFGPVDPNRFAQAFDAVVADQPEMETVFDAQSGAPSGSVKKPFPPFIDFSTETDPKAAAEDWTTKRAIRTFDLSQSTWDSCLIKLADGHWLWFINQHHIATDVWSMKVLFEAVSAAYQGKERPLPARLATRPDQDALTHWQDRAEQDFPASVPYGGTRNLKQPASQRLELKLSKAQSIVMRDMASSSGFRTISEDLSRFVLLATIYFAYLSRVTGDRSLQIGAPVGGRLTPEDKQTLGCFIELFPIHIEIDEADSFESLHKKVLSEVFSYLRFGKPGTSNAKLAGKYSAILNFIPLEIGDFAEFPVQTRWLHPGAHDPAHDLRLHAYDFDGTGDLTLAFDLNEAVFDTSLAPYVPQHFSEVLDCCLKDPQSMILHIPLGGEALSGPEEPMAGGTIFEALERQPDDAIAIEDKTHSLTYGQFRARIDAYAAGFAANGLSTGDAVLIHSPRSIEMVTAFWGAMRAGGMAVPIPAHAPSERLQRLAEQTGARQGYFAGSPPPDGIAQVAPLSANLPNGPGLSDPAYAIFTSGSTGEPKGVTVDHEGLFRYASWAAREHPGDYAFHTSIGFDLTITSLIVPFLIGRRLKVYPETPGTDLAVIDVFDDDAVDVVKLTPSHLALAIRKTQKVSRISTLILGGEALPTPLARRASELGDQLLTIANEYGPTEAVVGAMLHRFDPATDTDPTVSIGRPADGVQIAVMDAGQNPLPVGVAGEIYIAGRLATGYLGRPDLTNEKFVTINAKRWYKTGDLARVQPSGTISYLGRADEQLKIGGVRIEPAEIETVLENVPGVSNAYVTAIGHTKTYDQMAKACVTCGLSEDAPEADLDDAGICALCRGFETYKDRADVYFETPEALAQIITNLKPKRHGKYDAIMLLSGGKDSTYALYRLAELTSDILCLTLDNGFISEGAKTNIRAVADDLGLEHRFMVTPEMNAIFRDSLEQHSNVCQGCFKTIYTLAMRTARDEGIPAIVTGLSRGQFFETRLTPQLFEAGTPSRDDIDAFVSEARRAYHKVDDAVAKHLETSDLHDPQLLEDVTFIDLYRYIDVPVAEIYRFLDARAWKRPDDTGRSTNCRINDLGIFVHTKREGFHNYAIPYSWDVRMGHKTRDEAVDELKDDIDESAMFAMMSEIGLDRSIVDQAAKERLVAYVSGDADQDAIKASLARTLPPEMIPDQIVSVEEIPLTPNGKVDKNKLPAPAAAEASATFVAPETTMEHALAQIYCRILDAPSVGVTDNFYAMGGDSIAAIRIALSAAEEGLKFDATDIFAHQTIRALAPKVTTAPKVPEPLLDEAPLLDVGVDDIAAISAALSSRPRQ